MNRVVLIFSLSLLATSCRPEQPPNKGLLPLMHTDAQPDESREDLDIWHIDAAVVDVADFALRLARDDGSEMLLTYEPHRFATSPLQLDVSPGDRLFGVAVLGIWGDSPDLVVLRDDEGLVLAIGNNPDRIELDVDPLPDLGIEVAGETDHSERSGWCRWTFLSLEFAVEGAPATVIDPDDPDPIAAGDVVFDVRNHRSNWGTSTNDDPTCDPTRTMWSLHRTP